MEPGPRGAVSIVPGDPMAEGDMPRPTPNSSSERQGAMPFVPEVAPAHGCAASRSALGHARADALPPSVPHTASGNPQLGGFPITPNSPDGGASMKPPTAVAPAVYDSLVASRTSSDHVMGTALRDPASIAKEPCSGRFTKPNPKPGDRRGSSSTSRLRSASSDSVHVTCVFGRKSPRGAARQRCGSPAGSGCAAPLRSSA